MSISEHALLTVTKKIKFPVIHERFGMHEVSARFNKSILNDIYAEDDQINHNWRTHCEEDIYDTHDFNYDKLIPGYPYLRCGAYLKSLYYEMTNDVWYFMRMATRYNQPYVFNIGLLTQTYLFDNMEDTVLYNPRQTGCTKTMLLLYIFSYFNEYLTPYIVVDSMSHANSRFIAKRLKENYEKMPEFFKNLSGNHIEANIISSSQLESLVDYSNDKTPVLFIPELEYNLDVSAFLKFRDKHYWKTLTVGESAINDNLRIRFTHELEQAYTRITSFHDVYPYKKINDTMDSRLFQIIYDPEDVVTPNMMDRYRALLNRDEDVLRREVYMKRKPDIERKYGR